MKKFIGTIDLTPAWSGLTPGLLEVYCENRNETIHLELMRMASLADKYVELAKKLNVDNLAQIMREVNGNNDLGAGELAERLLDKIL